MSPAGSNRKGTRSPQRASLTSGKSVTTFAARQVTDRLRAPKAGLAKSSVLARHAGYTFLKKPRPDSGSGNRSANKLGRMLMSVAMSSGEPIGDNATSPPDLDGVRARSTFVVGTGVGPRPHIASMAPAFCGLRGGRYRRGIVGGMIGLPVGDEVVAREIQALGIVGLPLNGGTVLASSTISLHGPDDLRSCFLRPVLTGEERWCQLFSEPSAGSDLAGLTTRCRP